LKVVIPPGAVVDTHKHPAINAAVLLSGQLTIVSNDGEQIVVKEGEAVVEMVDKWHNGMNTGSEPAVLLVFCAGIKGQPLSVKQ